MTYPTKLVLDPTMGPVGARLDHRTIDALHQLNEMPEIPERPLATIEIVDAISPIEKADNVEIAHIKGWELVIEKGEVAAGEQVLYFEIDSLLPVDDARFAFLAKRSEIVHEGIRGHVLGTARIQGVWSQGLAISLTHFPELDGLPEGTDLAAALGIIKYEEPIPEALKKTISGGFPKQFAPKTSATRVQNLDRALPRLRAEHQWIATEKLDGTSTTFINDNGVLRCAGRGWEYFAPKNLSEATAPWLIADELSLQARIPVGYTIQGELVGPGVLAKNTLKLTQKKFFIFNVLFDGKFLPREQWPASLIGLSVPVVDVQLPETVAEMLEQVSGMKSLVNPAVQAEGIVWHNTAGTQIQALENRTGMKAINNKWLVKHS